MHVNGGQAVAGCRTQMRWRGGPNWSKNAFSPHHLVVPA